MPGTVGAVKKALMAYALKTLFPYLAKLVLSYAALRGIYFYLKICTVATLQGNCSKTHFREDKREKIPTSAGI